MGVLKELKELVRDMGGNAANARTASQAIDKIPASGGSSSAGGLKLNPVYDADNDTLTLDKTAKEIADAFDEHGNVYWIDKANGASVLLFMHKYSLKGVSYIFSFITADGLEPFKSQSCLSDEYPSYLNYRSDTPSSQL